MSEMIGKISVQEKIAELESRIVGLEERERLMTRQYSQQTVTHTTTVGTPFGEHWHKMWDEFHLAMKGIFK